MLMSHSEFVQWTAATQKSMAKRRLLLFLAREVPTAQRFGQGVLDELADGVEMGIEVLCWKRLRSL